MNITNPPLVGYVRTDQQGGIESLTAVQFHRPPRALARYATLSATALQQHPRTTLAEASERISQLSGVSRSPAPVGQLLKQLGLQRRKLAVLPATAMTDEHRRVQQEFREQQLEPRLAAANAGQRAVLFVAAAHVVYGAFLTGVWRVGRLWLPPPSRSSTGQRPSRLERPHPGSHPRRQGNLY